MHSLAIALQQAGHQVTGSDDQIYDPARSRLERYGLLPPAMGWDAARVQPDLDAVILGMHAFDDNPEWQKAQALGLKIFSFPEFIYEHARNKHRIVIAGSYGKTTVTSMIMHVLERVGKGFDYAVGADVPGFEVPVRLSDRAPVILIEGDEYLASRADPRPKFLLYQPHMTVITGISWDHINVFPTEAEYAQQFAKLVQAMPKAADIIYCEEDKDLAKMVEREADTSTHYLHPYRTLPYKVIEGQYHVKLGDERRPVAVIGKHNMANMAAAWEVCQLLSVPVEDFLTHIATFTGARARLQVLHERDDLVLIRDYAHAPAKVKASVEAVRERYRQSNLIACAELHTFSSLNKNFLPHYRHSLKAGDTRIVFLDPKALEKRRMPAISDEEIRQAFGDPKIQVAHTAAELEALIAQSRRGRDVLLLMSSGTFAGLDVQAIG